MLGESPESAMDSAIDAFFLATQAGKGVTGALAGDRTAAKMTSRNEEDFNAMLNVLIQIKELVKTGGEETAGSANAAAQTKVHQE